MSQAEKKRVGAGVFLVTAVILFLGTWIAIATIRDSRQESQYGQIPPARHVDCPPRSHLGAVDGASYLCERDSR